MFPKIENNEDAPNSQESTEVDPAGETFPSGQFEQFEAPGPLKVFSPHCLHPLSVTWQPALQRAETNKAIFQVTFEWGR